MKLGRYELQLVTGVINIAANGGARGVMVIVVGNGHSDTSSNPGLD